MHAYISDADTDNDTDTDTHVYTYMADAYTYGRRTCMHICMRELSVYGVGQQQCRYMQHIYMCEMTHACAGPDSFIYSFIHI